jgi:hypothetical protein
MIWNLLLLHAPRDTRLQPQKTKFPTNLALFLVLLTAKSETSARGKINIVKIGINRNMRDSYASRIKFVGTMARDFKRRDDPVKNGTSAHPTLHCHSVQTEY